MSVRYGTINQSNLNGVACEAFGDTDQNADKVLKVNLNKSPFNLDFAGNLPIGVQVNVGDEVITATAAVAHEADGDMMTVTFNNALNSEGVTINAIFEYATL
jgi:hypothetical protein